MKIIILSLLITQILTTMQVIQPETLKPSFNNDNHPGEIDYSVSLFGEILYTKSTSIQVILPIKKDNEEGCDSLTQPKSKLLNKTVWIVKRGGCTYSKKAYIAQQSGAYAVLVYHNDPDAIIDTIIPLADSTFNNIEIPIILISNKDGLILKSYLEKNNDLLLSLDIDTPGEISNHVSSEYWMSPLSLKSYEFLMQFKYSLDELGDKVDFKPSYKFKTIYDTRNEGFLKQHCFFKGEYCVLEDSKLSPVSVLQEGIRQICLWKLGNSSENPNMKNVWWNYISSYKTCLEKKLNKKTNDTLDCYEEILDNLLVGTDLQKNLENCIEDSYIDKNDFYNSDNLLLKEDKNSYQYSQIYLVPAFFINKQLVKEELMNSVIVSAICDKLITRPDICFSFDSPLANSVTRKTKKDNGLLVFSFILLSGICILFLIIICIKRQMNNKIDSEVNEEIQNHVTEYMRIRESQITS